MKKANPEFYELLDKFLSSVQKLSRIKSPNTRKVYGVLAGYPGQFLTVTEIVGKSGLKQSSVSGALAALRKAGLAQVMEDGNSRLYRLHTQSVNHLSDFLDRSLDTIKVFPFNWR